MEACRFTFKLLSACVVIVIWTYFLETIWIEDMLNENNKIQIVFVTHYARGTDVCSTGGHKASKQKFVQNQLQPCAQMRAQEALC